MNCKYNLLEAGKVWFVQQPAKGPWDRARVMKSHAARLEVTAAKSLNAPTGCGKELLSQYIEPQEASGGF